MTSPTSYPRSGLSSSIPFWGASSFSAIPGKPRAPSYFAASVFPSWIQTEQEITATTIVMQIPRFEWKRAIFRARGRTPSWLSHPSVSGGSGVWTSNLPLLAPPTDLMTTSPRSIPFLRVLEHNRSRILVIVPLHEFRALIALRNDNTLVSCFINGHRNTPSRAASS